MARVLAALAVAPLAVTTALALSPPARRAAFAVATSALPAPVAVAAPDPWPERLATLRGVAAEDALGDRLTIVSYNIKRAERFDRAASSLLAAAAVHRPDVILLQEAPLAFVESPLLEPLTEGARLFWAPFHTVERPDRRYPYPAYGQAILTRCRPRRTRVIPLPTVNRSTLGRGHRMQRIALYCELATGDGRIVGLVNLHYEPFAHARRRLRQYEATLAGFADRSPDVRLLCGDLNPTLAQHWEPGIRLLERSGFENALGRRWRTLDNCLALNHVRIDEAVALPLGGSDHRPIVVRLTIGGAG